MKTNDFLIGATIGLFIVVCLLISDDGNKSNEIISLYNQLGKASLEAVEANEKYDALLQNYDSCCSKSGIKPGTVVLWQIGRNDQGISRSQLVRNIDSITAFEAKRTKQYSFQLKSIQY